MQFLQLAHVTGPVIGGQQFQGRRVDTLDRFLLPFSEPADAVVDQQREILFPVPQGRQGKGHHAQPVVKVFPEASAFDLGFEIAVCRRDDPGVRLQPVSAAHPLELAFLEDAQQLHLVEGESSPTSSRKSVPPSASSNRPL